MCTNVYPLLLTTTYYYLLPLLLPLLLLTPYYNCSSTYYTFTSNYICVQIHIHYYLLLLTTTYYYLLQLLLPLLFLSSTTTTARPHITHLHQIIYVYKSICRIYVYGVEAFSRLLKDVGLFGSI